MSEEIVVVSFSLLHCKYLQPIYSHLLCYISNCNLAVIMTANGSTCDTHWHCIVQFEIKYCFGLYYVQPNYSWKRNTAKSCTEYSQNICSVISSNTWYKVRFVPVIEKCVCTWPEWDCPKEKFVEAGTLLDKWSKEKNRKKGGLWSRWLWKTTITALSIY